jgi:endogenous inhibitor of DNA gyrase (YacG/DUF329 family)
MCQAPLDVPVVGEFRPFCSARCKRLDLLNWLEGRYNLPRELSPEEISELTEEEREALLGAVLTPPASGSVH